MKNKNILWFVIAILSFLFIVTYILLPNFISYNEHFHFEDPGSVVAQATKSMRISKYLGDFTELAYFTILTGIIFTTFFILYTLPIKRKFISDDMMTNVIMYEVIIMFIYWTMLAPFGQPANKPISFTMDGIAHGLIPIIAIIYYFQKRKEFKLSNFKIGLYKSLLYPLIYYFSTWIFYVVIKGQACIYPFLDYYHPFSLNVAPVWDVVIDIAIFASLVGVFVGCYWINYKLVK